MTFRWQISVGELTRWLSPLLYGFSVLASAWVLHDARARRFPLYAVAAWTLATLIYTPIVLPLYLIARTFKPYPAAPDAASPETTVPETTEDAGLKETAVTGSGETVAAEIEEIAATGIVEARGEIPDDTGKQAAPQPTPIIRASLRLKRYAPSILYAFALLLAGAIYSYHDYYSFDAHLARAANALLLNQRTDAIREYRAALCLADDAHTRKLLGIQLAEDGQTEAALAEFRAAERGGEPDELLPYRVASALDTLGRAAEAADEYRKFLRSSLCAPPSPETRCTEAAARLSQTHGGALTH